MVTNQLKTGNLVKLKSRETQIGETRSLVASSALVPGGGLVGRGLALNGRHQTDNNLGHAQVPADLWHGTQTGWFFKLLGHHESIGAYEISLCNPLLSLKFNESLPLCDPLLYLKIQ